MIIRFQPFQPCTLWNTSLFSLSLTCCEMLVCFFWASTGASEMSESCDPGESFRGSDAPRPETCAGELHGRLLRRVKLQGLLNSANYANWPLSREQSHGPLKGMTVEQITRKMPSYLILSIEPFRTNISSFSFLVHWWSLISLVGSIWFYNSFCSAKTPKTGRLFCGRSLMTDCKNRWCRRTTCCRCWTRRTWKAQLCSGSGTLVSLLSMSMFFPFIYWCVYRDIWWYLHLYISYMYIYIHVCKQMMRWVYIYNSPVMHKRHPLL